MRRTHAWTAFAVGVGTARLVETIKETLLFVPAPSHKSTFASVVAGTAGAVLSSGDWRERTLVALAACGTAMLAHELQAVLSLTGDRAKVSVIQGSSFRK